LAKLTTGGRTLFFFKDPNAEVKTREPANVKEAFSRWMVFCFFLQRNGMHEILENSDRRELAQALLTLETQKP
jgi:hypothetical protein